MDLLRLFLSASASPLVQARTAGPLAVDTGPPGSGGPPLVVEGFQKEVTAKELKPQATILDLLESILPTDALSVKHGKPGGLTVADLAISLGELKAKVETPDFGDILAALGVTVPPKFDATNLGQFKKALSEAVVDSVVPAPVKALFARIVRALGDFERAAANNAQPQTVPVATPPIRVIPIGRLPLDEFGEPEPIGPPIQVDPRIKLAETTSPAVNVRVQSSAGPRPTIAPVVQATASLSDLFRTTATRERDPAGRLDQTIVESLKVSSLSVDRSKPIDLSALAESVLGRRILAKAPLRTIVDPKNGTIEVPIGQTERTTPSIKSLVADQAAALLKSGPVRGVLNPAFATLAPAPTIRVGEPDKPRPTVKEVDGVRASVNASSDSATLGKAKRSEDRATVKEKPVDVKASKDEQELDVSSALAVEKEDTIQLGKPERTLDVSSVKEAKSAKQEITTQQYHEAKAKVIEQIEEIAATRGNGKVTIRLNPDDLGTITLAVRSFGDNVEAKVTASNDNVRQALHTHRADLVQSVESRGLSMNSFTVGSESNADAQQQGNGKQQGQDMRQEFARSHNLWGNRHDQTPAPRPMFQGLRYAGVDTFA